MEVAGDESQVDLGHVEGAHLLPRNISPPEYNPADKDWIVTLSRWWHSDLRNPDALDANHTVRGRYQWCLRHGLDREAEMLKMLVDKGW